MKTAIIGLGVIGKVHLETLIMQGRTVSALCDIDAEEAKKAAERFGCDVPIFTDFRAMLEEEVIRAYEEELARASAERETEALLEKEAELAGQI